MSLAIVSIVVVVVAIGATVAIVAQLKAARDEAARGRALALMTLFAPALEQAQRDPRALVVWEPLARRARALMPEEMAALDRAAGARFPFSAEIVQAAHAQWTADWLAWERTHDADYKLKSSEIEHELAASGGAPFLRAKLEAVEREKLDRYQRRYQEYVQVGKALQALETI